MRHLTIDAKKEINKVGAHIVRGALILWLMVVLPVYLLIIPKTAIISVLFIIAICFSIIGIIIADNDIKYFKKNGVYIGEEE